MFYQVQPATSGYRYAAVLRQDLPFEDAVNHALEEMDIFGRDKSQLILLLSHEDAARFKSLPEGYNPAFRGGLNGIQMWDTAQPQTLLINCSAFRHLLEGIHNKDFTPTIPYVAAERQDVVVGITVNGTHHECHGETLTYDQIVELANTGRKGLHSIVYFSGRGKHKHDLPYREGMVVPGQVLTINEGMDITALVTDGA